MAQTSENIRYGGFDEDEMSQPTIRNHAIALDDYIVIWMDRRSSMPYIHGFYLIKQKQDLKAKAQVL